MLHSVRLRDTVNNCLALPTKHVRRASSRLTIPYPFQLAIDKVPEGSGGEWRVTSSYCQALHS